MNSEIKAKLEALGDECVKNYRRRDSLEQQNIRFTAKLAFMAGCEALDKLYLESVPVWDENPAIKQAFIINAKTPAVLFNNQITERYFSENNAMALAVDLARWQFDQNAAQIAALQSRISQLENELKHRGRECAEYQVEVQSLREEVRSKTEAAKYFSQGGDDLHSKLEAYRQAVRVLGNWMKNINDHQNYVLAIVSCDKVLSKHADVIAEVMK